MEEIIDIIEVRRVLQRKDGVKMTIIPKKSKIKKGELVIISNNLNLINKLKREDLE